MSDTSRPRVVSYVVALLSAAIAILLKTSLNSLVPNSSPYLLGLAPVMVAAWYGGLGPGILATIIVAVAGNYLYAEPRWSFLLGTPGEVLHFLLFIVEGILISALSAMLHRSRRSAERQAEEARMHEETLRQSEERFRIAAGCASDLTYEIDLRTGIIEWFGDIDGRLGYAPGKFPRTAQARLEMIYPDDRPMVREAMDRHLADRRPFEVEYRVIRADGALLRWTDRARATWDAGGAPLKWIGVNTDITERKQAEESLTESESRYRNLVETSPDAIVLVDDRFVIAMANERTARLHGYATAAEMIGMEARAFVAVMPWEHAVGKIDQALAEPTDRGEEVFLQRKDGSSFPAEIRASAIRGSDGTPHGYIAVVTDVTERRIIEKRLREQTEVVETVNSIGRLLSAELDQQRLVQALTDAATDLTGAQFGAFFYNVQDESGEWYMMYSLSGVGSEMFAHFPMPRNTDIFGPTFRGDGVLRLDDVRKDPRYGRNSPYYGMPPGHLPVVSYLAVPVVSRMGEVFGGLFFGHPEPGMFTERQEQIITGLAAQAAIAIDNARLFEDARRERANAEASERHYRILTEAIPSIVWTALPDGRLDYCNQQWATYSGMTSEATLGWGWASALHPDDVQYSRDLWLQTVETGGNYEIEYRFRRASDGAYRWHLGRAIPVRDEHGDILRWFGTCTDIDDQKRAQETLKFLAEASTILGSGNESHDALLRVASMAVPIIADWCVIDLADPESGSISRVAVANADAAGVELG
ncbi:MAG: PAS domain S-box protein, partial [Candidatus Kapaibacterium sp.]